MISAIVSFDEKLKFAVHIAQICCIIVAIGLSIGRFTITSPPPSRANMVSITLGIKSFIVIGYQLLTEHTARFRKWASTKANAILNALEIVFWLAVLVVTGKGLGRSSGSAAAVEAFILIMAIILEILCIWMAGCSIKVHRRAKMFRSNFGVATATSTYPQTMPRSHGYPPSSMQERK